ncbi:MAG: hypothetical protein HYV28_01380 [Ignavibacteriales bacterium]|nr:hypothetical protein [Ignavibacteriales bacterium]
MKKYWIGFATVLIASFAVLGWVGTKIYQQKPPIPEMVVTTDGKIVFNRTDIEEGQNVWQAMGGMETGSVWGHGSYVAPDWTADWLHRELIIVLDKWALKEWQQAFDKLDKDKQAVLTGRMKYSYRENTFNSSTGVLTITPERAAAIEENTAYYSAIFKNGKDEYAIQKNAVTDSEKFVGGRHQQNWR